MLGDPEPAPLFGIRVWGYFKGQNAASWLEVRGRRRKTYGSADYIYWPQFSVRHIGKVAAGRIGDALCP